MPGRESEAHPAFSPIRRTNSQRGETFSAARAEGRTRHWPRHFWEHANRDGGDYERHMDDLHDNPVKHGHLTRVADWPYSSFHRYVERGIYDLERGADDNVRRLEME